MFAQQQPTADLASGCSLASVSGSAPLRALSTKVPPSRKLTQHKTGQANRDATYLALDKEKRR